MSSEDEITLFQSCSTQDEEIDLCLSTCKAVQDNALDVLDWIVEKDETYYNLILHDAIHHHRTGVLRWLPREQLKKISKRDLFVKACSAPNMDMFNFLLEVDYVTGQTITVSLRLAESRHVQMMRTLVLDKGWVLSEEMFDAALERGCTEMLSCLFELGCPHDETQALYQTVKDDNIPWLIKNLPLTEDGILDVCMKGPENVLVQLIRQGCLPDSFIDDPEITFAALEEGFTQAGEEYLQQGYVFGDDVCLRVENKTSLEWLIDRQVNLSPDLYYRLSREEDLPLLRKLLELTPE
ncbi:Pseudo ankyrin repeat-like [Cedratvirus A11]|uniref:Pseudo ankyrin repeat-like n=1 Tax=Cedratvirus A11 TaxID=1903266 RepID=A0A1M7XVE9_9VIRU|nr:Pseudo ankyrin repeat-like [Cedratvirus A11]SHO33641.1 Pseudo ankyrin repeat-like [Cedratvirus A11]